MLAELEAVLGSALETADRAAYASAIIESNCLGKPTASTRRLSNQRLGELYALDPRAPVFCVLRKLWNIDACAHPLLAMLAALARDPLFMASALPILSLPIGAELQRASVRETLRAVVGERMNDAVLDKVVRNVASSWTQTGHLQGRTFKVRQRVQAQPTSLVFALYLGYLAGFRGEALFSNGWIAALDCTASSARALALEAKRVGLIDFHGAEDVIEVGFEHLDPGIGRR